MDFWNPQKIVWHWYRQRLTDNLLVVQLADHSAEAARSDPEAKFHGFPVRGKDGLPDRSVIEYEIKFKVACKCRPTLIEITHRPTRGVFGIFVPSEPGGMEGREEDGGHPRAGQWPFRRLRLSGSLPFGSLVSTHTFRRLVRLKRQKIAWLGKGGPRSVLVDKVALLIT
jgi:hypothetical protein